MVPIPQHRTPGPDPDDHDRSENILADDSGVAFALHGNDLTRPQGFSCINPIRGLIEHWTHLRYEAHHHPFDHSRWFSEHHVLTHLAITHLQPRFRNGLQLLDPLPRHWHPRVVTTAGGELLEGEPGRNIPHLFTEPDPIIHITQAEILTTLHELHGHPDSRWVHIAGAIDRYHAGIGTTATRLDLAVATNTYWDRWDDTQRDLAAELSRAKTLPIDTIAHAVDSL